MEKVRSCSKLYLLAWCTLHWSTRHGVSCRECTSSNKRPTLMPSITSVIYWKTGKWFCFPTKWRAGLRPYVTRRQSDARSVHCPNLIDKDSRPQNRARLPRDCCVMAVMLEEFNMLNSKPQHFAELKVELQTIGDNPLTKQSANLS